MRRVVVPAIAITIVAMVALSLLSEPASDNPRGAAAIAIVDQLPSHPEEREYLDQLFSIATASLRDIDTAHLSEDAFVGRVLDAMIAKARLDGREPIAARIAIARLGLEAGIEEPFGQPVPAISTPED